MKSSIFTTVVFTTIGSVYAASLNGLGITYLDGDINWNAVKANGIEFAYILATEGPNFKDPNFKQNYVGATNAGLIRGAIHTSHPSESSGAAQANYFLKNGGGWSSDGITLPGALVLQDDCEGLSKAEMVSWIKEFSNTYQSKTGRYPVLYTTTSWWRDCTRNNATFGKDNPLWIARFDSTPGPLPAGWSSYTFWEKSGSSPNNPGYDDQFNGDSSSLKKFASNK